MPMYIVIAKKAFNLAIVNEIQFGPPIVLPMASGIAVCLTDNVLENCTQPK